MLQLYSMDTIQSVILSVVEGITEFLPISSTGHLILTSKILGIQQTEFVKSFEIIVQLGAILAVVVIYFKKLILSLNFKLYKNLIIAFIPTALFGLFFYDYIKLYLIGNTTVVIISLIVGGIAMLLFENRYNKEKENTIKPHHFLVIGLFQVLSMIPGVSRAFATIFGGMFVGMKRKDATEFSFFLAVPTMIAASGIDLIKTDLSIWTNENLTLLSIGFIGSFVTAYITVKFLIKFVQGHNFNLFGWYRIILGLIFLIFSI